jgi:hypothetical protein
MKTIMPSIDVGKLTDRLTSGEKELVGKIIRIGHLKANCPKLEMIEVKTGNFRYRKASPETAKIAYLWMQVARKISPYKCHSSLYPDTKIIIEDVVLRNRLKEIAEIIVNNTPKAQHYWEVAYGIR